MAAFANNLIAEFLLGRCSIEICGEAPLDNLAHQFLEWPTVLGRHVECRFELTAGIREIGNAVSARPTLPRGDGIFFEVPADSQGIRQRNAEVAGEPG